MKKNITAGFYATTATVWLIVALTVISEKVKPFKEWLAGITGHHWVTKGVFSLIFFAVVLLALSKIQEKENSVGQARVLLWNVLAGTLVIFVFYLLHYFGMI